MIKKIRDSLSAKVFIWIAGLLILCSLLIYGIVMIILPKSYTTVTIYSTDMLTVYGIGALMLILAVLLAAITVVRLKPRMILSEME